MHRDAYKSVSALPSTHFHPHFHKKQSDSRSMSQFCESQRAAELPTNRSRENMFAAAIIGNLYEKSDAYLRWSWCSSLH